MKTHISSKIALVKYHPELGNYRGKVAYTIHWEDVNIGKECNEKGIRGQVFFDRGEGIDAMKNKGFSIKFSK